VRALTFDYNGIAKQELSSARAIAAQAGVLEHRVIRLPDLKEAGDIPGFRAVGLPASYIPLRNSIFYSFAAAYAEETGASSIVGGHNRDDAEVFEDVSPEFFSALQEAFWAGSRLLRKRRITIVRPLRGKRKPEVIRLAASKGVPLELTWSCHRDGEEHCWKCDGCAARRRAFFKAGIEDPLAPVRPGKIT
jgi:7-cyano-7-deazaguanine synthase